MNLGMDGMDRMHALRKPIVATLEGKNPVLAAVDAGHYMQTVSTQPPGGKKGETVTAELCRKCKTAWPCKVHDDAERESARRTNRAMGVMIER